MIKSDEYIYILFVSSAEDFQMDGNNLNADKGRIHKLERSLCAILDLGPLDIKGTRGKSTRAMAAVARYRVV